MPVHVFLANKLSENWIESEVKIILTYTVELKYYACEKKYIEVKKL